jgi:hypothetical protein
MGALLCVAACGATEPVRAPGPHGLTHVASANTFLSTPPIAQYRLAWRWPEQRAPSEALVSGLRVEQKPWGLNVADTIAKPPLQNGRPLPGGNYVFWSQQGVFRSLDFTARLQPLAAAAFAIDSVSFGPGFWLVRGAGGERIAIDPKTGDARAPVPAGLIDIAADPDGRVVAALELGRAVVSADYGQGYRDVTSELDGTTWKLSTEPLGFTSGIDRGWELTKEGKLSPRVLASKQQDPNNAADPRLNRRRATPNRRTDPRFWVPLNEAVSSGVMGTPGSALVALGASLAEVDLESGKIISQGPQLLPGAPDCELLRFNSELLMACPTPDALAVLSLAPGKPPMIERRFNGHPELRVGGGQLLVEASCDSADTPFSVCIRQASGDWKRLSKPEEPTTPASGGSGGGPAAATKPPQVLAYVPRADGGAVALVREPVRGYIDLGSGHAVALSGDFDSVQRSPENCVVDNGGSLRCITPNGPLAFDREGKQEPNLFHFNWTAAAGRRALGRDVDGRLFQTDDFGRSWVEVAAPPAWGASSDYRDGCSEVGCMTHGWLRTGWERTPPRTADPPEILEIAEAAAPRVPRLICHGLQPPALTVANPLSPPSVDGADAEASPFALGFGNEQLRGDRSRVPLGTPAPSQTASTGGDLATRGMLTGRSQERTDPRHPDETLTVWEPLRFRFVSHFEPTARPQVATITFAELVHAAQRLGAPAPNLDLEGLGGLNVTPVLAREPGRSAGFVVSLNEARVWVNGAHAVALSPTPDSWIASGAALDRDGSLLVLFSGEDLATRLWRFRQGAGGELFVAPPSPRTEYATADALGVSGQGELALLRFPSGQGPPTMGDPALAYVPGKPPQQLAPWSRLKPLGDPACPDKSGYRTIIATPAPWLSLQHGGDEIADAWGMLAVVRWSAERVCLEALEMPDADFEHADETTETRIVFTETPKPAAARIGFAPGFELREPLSCELVGPP